MIMLLPLLFNEPRPGQPFILLQSTTAQSIFSLLRALSRRPSTHNIVYTFLYAPSSFVGQGPSAIELHDWNAEVPGYNDTRNLKIDLLSAIKNAPKNKSLNLVVDSLETLAENLASPLETYGLLHEVLELIKRHPCPSQLIIHSVKLSETAILLLQTHFSSSLIHLTAYPTSLFLYLAKEYMISPPPVTLDIKFWGVFIPFSERIHEVERLCFGFNGEGSCNTSEMVIEILTRGVNGRSKKRGTERMLDGWDSTKSLPSSISDLQNLKPLFSQKPMAEAGPDPTQNLPFNLSLSESQQQSRAQVPLPYAHEGQTCSYVTQKICFIESTGQRPDAAASNTGAIFYDPDSADDIDDDDPDDDLDI